MDQSVILIINCLLGFFSTFIVFDFMSKFGRIIYRPKYVYVLSYIAITVVLLMIGMFVPSALLNVLVSLIGTVIIGYFLFNNTKIYMMYYAMFIVVMTVFQVVVSFVYGILCSSGMLNFFNTNGMIISSAIVIQFANLSASRLFVNWFKDKSINKLSNIQLFNFLVLPIFSIFYIVTLMMYMETFGQFKDSLLIIINIASIIALNIFITNIFQSISKNNEMKSQLSLYEQQANMQHDYYNNLELKYQDSRKLIHDIKNHIQTIESLYGVNKGEKASFYKDDLYSMFGNLEQKIYTENKVLNIIINDKINRAKEFGIYIDCKIGDVNLEKIRDIDLTTIFANLLDNAIDEVKEFDKDKVIFLKVDKFNDFIVVNITNALRSKPVKNKEDFKSTKKNHQGLGLQNVKLAIEKYEGTLRINFDDEHFKVNIVIPTN